MRTWRWAATAATRSVVTSGSGLADARSGTVRAVSRRATACRATFVGSTNNAEAYAGEWLAHVPIPFTVVGGPELRAAVRVVAERLARSVSG